MKKTILILIVSSLASQICSANALSTCIGCHGQNGIGLAETFPNLAGQKKTYLINQLTAFKSGARVNQMMNPIAAQLTDQDINEVATYYSGLHGN